MAGWGGFRAGGGRPKGAENKATRQARLEKEVLRELVKNRIAKELPKLIDAQLAHAKGLKYLVIRDKKSGKFLRVTEAMAKAKQGTINEDEETIEVWEKDPSVQAFTDLLNRAIDKPKEQEQEIKVTGELELVAIKLTEARRRLAARAIPVAAIESQIPRVEVDQQTATPETADSPHQTPDTPAETQARQARQDEQADQVDQGNSG